MSRKHVSPLARATYLAITLLTCPAAFPQTIGKGDGSANAVERLIPLDVLINNTSSGQWVLLERNGTLYAPEEAFVEWRLNRRADAAVVERRGQKWIPLNSVPGFESKFDYANQSVELVFSSKAFEATRLTEEAAARPPLTTTVPAAFLNYDLSYTSSQYSNAPGNRELGALTELGLSANGGVLTSSFVGRNLTGNIQTQPNSWTRLETTYTYDMLDSNNTLKVGDTTTRRGTWGRPVYFGGLQISHNFALTPGFVSQPIPSLTGTSYAPSTVELYVNDVLRQTSNVPTGPFTVANFPLLTGSGDARMVVRDVLGRETVIEQSFFTHPYLLEQGLTDWSAETGAVRNNFGVSNASYGQRFVSGMVRHGVSKSLTVESQGEFGQATRDVGAGLDYALPFRALGQVAASASNDQVVGGGTDWMLGINKTSLRHTYSARVERATFNYRQVGQPGLPYRIQISGNYSYALDEHSGLVALGVARIDTYDRGTLTTYSGNYSRRVGDGSLTFTAAKVIGSMPGYSLGAMFMMPLGGRVNMTSNVSRQSGTTDAYVSASKGLTDANGVGWRALGGNRAGSNYAEGGLYYQGDKGLLSSDVSTSTSQQTMRLGAQGGVVLMDGRAFMSRRVQDSFALVEVPGYANVGVGFQNQTLAHTDENGVALVPRLLPYQRNSIRLDPTELPINAELDSIEQVVVPAARSGVKVTFPVRSGRGALIHVKLENGEDAPAGATVELVGDKEEFYVGRRGQLFVTGLKDKNTLYMKLDGTACSFDVSLPPDNPNDMTRVGPVTCSARAQTEQPTTSKGNMR